MDDYEDIPDDNRLAFLKFEKEFREKFELETQDQNSNYAYHAQSYMNHVMACARELEILDLIHFEVLPFENKQFSFEFTKFKSAVDQLRVQYRIRVNRVAKAATVGLTFDQKALIHQCLAKIREQVEQSAATLDKKEKIYRIIASLSAEVDQQRTGFGRIGDLTRGLAGLSKHVAEKGAAPWVKLINEIWRVASDAEEAELQLPKPDEVKRIEPPRKELPKPLDDDEIPF